MQCASETPGAHRIRFLSNCVSSFVVRWEVRRDSLSHVLHKSNLAIFFFYFLEDFGDCGGSPVRSVCVCGTLGLHRGRTKTKRRLFGAVIFIWLNLLRGK